MRYTKKMGVMSVKKPSVSELLQILNKPALLKWANRIGLEGVDIDSYMNNAKKKGTNIHDQVERYFKHGVPLESEQHHKRIVEFFKGCEVLNIEEPLETEYFTGRADIRFKQNGVVYLCDFKRNFKRPYLEHHIQLNCYKMALECDRLGIISLPDFTFHSITSDNHEKYAELIINLSNIYKLKHELWNK